MAITKILYRNGGLAQAIQYITNPDKTDQCVLVDHINCDPGFAYQQMMNTKRRFHKTDGRQCYHIIQSFKPDEITPELAHEIAKRFATEHLQGYEAVIGTHVDKGHIHSHIVFNSVNADTGIKYHSTLQNYYQQIRGISDRLCAENGLSVILQGERTKTVSYIEWLRQSKGQPTFRSMLEADLREAIADANDLGHFFLLMEHKGYEIHHGNRLGFRLRGQERFMYPERKNAAFSEENIERTIAGNLAEIEAGIRPAFVPRPKPQPYRPHPKYKGFLALYYLNADRKACIRIIQNLIFNAVTSTTNNVVIQLINIADSVQLCIKNPVASIPTEEYSKLLERFYVADVSRSNGTSGQGLYIVKKLLLMMNCTNPIIEIHDHNFMITIDFSPLLIKK